MDSPFALTSISQAQFWRRELNDYGDGTVKESFSTIISDWVTPGWFLDPAIKATTALGGQRVINETPLFIQHPGSWRLRPGSATAIPNLFLAGDWVRTNINVTTMDGANQAGRQAANRVLDAASSNSPRAALWSLYVPPEYEPLRALDSDRYRRGLPNVFDPDHEPPVAMRIPADTR